MKLFSTIEMKIIKNHPNSSNIGNSFSNSSNMSLTSVWLEMRTMWRLGDENWKDGFSLGFDEFWSHMHHHHRMRSWGFDKKKQKKRWFSARLFFYIFFSSCVFVSFVLILKHSHQVKTHSIYRYYICYSLFVADLSFSIYGFVMMRLFISIKLLNLIFRLFICLAFFSSSCIMCKIYLCGRQNDKKARENILWCGPSKFVCMCVCMKRHWRSNIYYIFLYWWFRAERVHFFIFLFPTLQYI